MNARIVEGLYKMLFIFCICHFAISNVVAEDRNPLWDVQYQFVKEGYGLKGPVFSVTTKRMNPVVELGQVVSTNVIKLDSLVFDETGHIAKKCDFRDSPNVTTYVNFTDSIEYSVLGQYGNPECNAIAYKHDASGRIIEVKYYEEGKLKARRVFEYTPTGFESIYYRDKKEVAYARKGNEFAEVGGSFPKSGKLDKDGRIISQTASVPFVAKSTTFYTYNQNGDLVRKGNKTNLGNNVVGTLRSNESGYRYEYVYDNYGNWTEKRTYKDGKLQKEYEVREIVYKTSEEIIAEKKAELERNRLFEETLQRSGEEYATKFTEDYCRQIFKERLVSCADNYLRNSVPVVDFSVSDDRYSFDLSDGTKVSNVKFEKLDRRINYDGGWDNLISSDLHLVLIPEYTQHGPKWYIVNYGTIADFDFDPAHSTDWVKLYRDKYHSRNNVSDEDIKQLWKDELYRQWNDSKCCNIDKRTRYLSVDSICVNELVDAYDKGFVSPNASNKEKEIESLEKYKKFKEDEKRKNLCAIAISACVFNDKNKPEADKLKKFTCDDSGYYFKKKNKNEIVNQKFDTMLSGGDADVYLSSDQSVAMVLKRAYLNFYLFIVELDGDNVKSVNYSPIDIRKFQHPASVQHIY